ncbi:MAG: hypothetical protein HYV09_25615 [Deltaproteobacteria bacterium]|nr:hypothetical protein [Deltaproteobacteria bacterium]
MRALLAPALVLAALSAGAVVPGCQEKSGVEKRAEELAAANSAAKSAAAASASQVDPAELKYRERKTSLEKTIKEFKASEGRIMAGDPVAKPGILEPYFPDDADGKKRAKDLETKRRKEGSDGFRINKLIEPLELRVSGNMEEAEVEITEQAAAKGLPACIWFEQTWKRVGEKWVMSAQKTAKKVDCP